MPRRKASVSVPGFLPPSLATSVRHPPAGDDWVHEIKFDGYRVQVIAQGGEARIYTRTGLDWTARFRSLARSAGKLTFESIAIDAEAVVLDPEGISRFGLLQAELKRGKSTAIRLMAFDLLHLEGNDVTPLPLIERKSLLKDALAKASESDLLRYVEHMTGDGPAILAEVCTMGLEGIISKRAARPYRSGRHGDWTKAKCSRADPFVVIGFTKQVGNGDLIGALVLGFYANGKLVYAGRVGTGFSMADARAMLEGLMAIRARAPGLAKPPTTEQRNGVIWVRPVLVAQVAYADLTADGLVRHAVFQHFRTDKPPREIARPSGER